MDQDARKKYLCQVYAAYAALGVIAAGPSPPGVKGLREALLALLDVEHAEMMQAVCPGWPSASVAPQERLIVIALNGGTLEDVVSNDINLFGTAVVVTEEAKAGTGEEVGLPDDRIVWSIGTVDYVADL